MLGRHQFNMYYQDGGYPEEIKINFDNKNSLINSVTKHLISDLATFSVDYIDESRQNKDYEYDVYCGKYEDTGKSVPHITIIAISLDAKDEEETLGNIMMFSDLILKEFLKSIRIDLKKCDKFEVLPGDNGKASGSPLIPISAIESKKITMITNLIKKLGGTESKNITLSTQFNRF